jgi:apolipoprotein D and lipocalin family protein
MCPFRRGERQRDTISRPLSLFAERLFDLHYFDAERRRRTLQETVTPWFAPIVEGESPARPHRDGWLDRSGAAKAPSRLIFYPMNERAMLETTEAAGMSAVADLSRRLPGPFERRRDSAMSARARVMRRVVGALWGIAMAAGCARSTTERLHLPPLTTVAHVDLSRYVGTWYELANFPTSFQRGCTATTATYALRDDGDIEVVNRCREGTLEGKEKSARGRARVVDGTTNAKLEVSFFRPFWGDYWIIELADDYSHAVIGHPGRDYLWILARTPTMAETTYQGIVARLQAKGYETSRLVRTLQAAGLPPDTSPTRPDSSVAR